MKKPKVKVKYLHPLMEELGLTYATDGSNAVDVRCMEDIALSPNVCLTIGLGFALELPEGYGAILLPRSGLGSKFGIELNNTLGLIDSDYRGEVRLTLRMKPMDDTLRDNYEEVYVSSELEFKAGSRIAQMAIVPIPQAEFEPVQELSTTERGHGGYGHTGI